jgi:hypothetical protein
MEMDVNGEERDPNYSTSNSIGHHKANRACSKTSTEFEWVFLVLLFNFDILLRARKIQMEVLVVRSVSCGEKIEREAAAETLFCGLEAFRPWFVRQNPNIV